MPLEEIMSRWYDGSPAHDDYSRAPLQSADEGKVPSENVANRFDNHTDSPYYGTTSMTDQTTKDLRASTNHVAEHEGSESHHSKHDFATYRRLLLQSPAYRWLTTSLRREVLLTAPETNLMDSIREEIICSLPRSRTISRTQSAEAYMITYQLDWNPSAFFKEQGYKEDPGDVVETVITLTGSTRDAQALVCAQYLSQTWPFTGDYVIQLLKRMLRDAPGDRHTCKLLDQCST
jgi:hypothetical protein